MRRAADGADFTADVRALTGVEPHILSGDEEATYSFLGATSAIGGDERVGVLDVGGGSTRTRRRRSGRKRASARRVAYTCSVEVGAVRLAERHPALLGARGPRAGGTRARPRGSACRCRGDSRAVRRCAARRRA